MSVDNRSTTSHNDPLQSVQANITLGLHYLHQGGYVFGGIHFSVCYFGLQILMTFTENIDNGTRYRSRSGSMFLMDNVLKAFIIASISTI